MGNLFIWRKHVKKVLILILILEFVFSTEQGWVKTIEDNKKFVFAN